MNIIQTQTQKTLILKLNRASTYNSLNRETILDLTRLIHEAQKNPMVAVIILCAEGKAFCTGQDLNELTGDLGQNLEELWNPLIESIRLSEKIIISVMEGVVAGAGISLALACDFKIAKPELKMIPGFANLALIPDAGLSHLLVRSMGQTKALQFCLMNKVFSSTDFYQFGLINELSENAYETALNWAQELAQKSLQSLRWTKQNLREAVDFSWSQSLQNEKMGQRTLGNLPDYQEGVQAFKEKRKAQFKG
ncbi:MAG: enoyl-CoA hydratase/isomerase family protein [Bacteriovoracaceae bacterium]